jgi:phage protein D/phage baseplate assembly protein gpV
MASKSKDNVAPITIKIDGKALDPAKGNKLLEVVVKKTRVVPDSALVKVADIDQKLVDAGIAKFGVSLEILVGGPNDTSAKSLFKGDITTIEPEFGQDGVLVGMRAYDKSHAMTKTKRLRNFQDQTAGDMIKKAAADYFPDGISVEDDSSPYEYMMQSSESDWDFCWRLAKRHGLEFICEGSKAIVRKAGKSDGDAPWLQYGQSEAGHRLMSFRPRITNANVAETYKASYVDHKNQVVEVEVKFKGNALTTAKQVSSGFSPKAVGTAKAKGTVSIANAVAKNAAELRTYIESIRDTMVNSAFEADGVAEGDPDLKPGKKVQLKGVGSYSGTFVLSETTHIYRGGAGFITRFVIASQPKMLIDAVNPPNDVDDPVGLQLMRGEVTNTSDPDNIGRVRVKIPTLKDDEAPEGWWARIASVNAGKERGLLMMPKVGDTVVIGFENGDTRSPLVLGSLWNGQATPGKDLVQDDTSFSLMSDSKILMKSKGDITVEGSKQWVQKVQKMVELSNSMDTFTIKSGKEIVIKAPQIKIVADMKIEMKAPQISISADATLDLKASAVVTIGGGLVKLG